MTKEEDFELEKLKRELRIMELENKKIVESVDAIYHPEKVNRNAKIEGTGAKQQLPEEEIDPVQRYLNPEQTQNVVNKEIDRMHKVDENFIPKRTAAGEVIKPLKIVSLLALINVIGFFVQFLFSLMGLVLVNQIVIVVFVSVNAYYVVKAKRQITYLSRKYNIMINVSRQYKQQNDQMQNQGF
jgi:hypothetical protein